MTNVYKATIAGISDDFPVVGRALVVLEGPANVTE
jgi:hypothetical protein